MTKPRVLVVDDEREIREAIRIYLRGEDIETNGIINKNTF